jgi:hypothetical protein
MKDQTNHHNNNNPSISTCQLIIQIFCVTPLAIAIFDQSNTHINTLTIIHNNTKSTNGSSSRKAHNFVIHPLKEILKFHKNNPTIASNITNHDFHSIPESKNLTPLPLAFTTGKRNKQNVKTAK